MATLDIETYRNMVLKEVEKCFLDSRDDFSGVSSYEFYQAMRSELNRADPDTGLIETPSDWCESVDGAASRILDHIRINHDLGFGAAN